jgi:TolB-like protein
VARQSHTIAVLPFVNISADPADDYFSDGLTEELVNALARLPSVRITARRSAFGFKGTDRDVREIGRLLGAGKIVTGSVRKAEDRLRITVQLVNVADGYQLWSGEYDRTMNDVFAVQEEIAGAIRLTLGSLRDEGQVPRAAPPTRSVDALNQYLLARFHWNKRNELASRRSLTSAGDPDRS